MEDSQQQPSHRGWRTILLLLVAFVVMGGCYSQPGNGQTPPSDVLVFAQESIAMLQARDVDGLVRRLAPQPVSPDVHVELARMADALPKGSARLVAFIHNPSNEATDLAFAIGPDEAPSLVRISIQRTQHSMVVRGLFADSLTAPLSEVLAMSWRGKGAAHYVIFAGAIAIPVFIVLTLVRCLRVKILGRRWAWAIVILLGVGQLTLNWQTGEFAFQPVFIQFLGAGYIAPLAMSPVAWPLLISVSLPVGAIAFHVRLWRAQRMVNLI